MRRFVRRQKTATVKSVSGTSLAVNPNEALVGSLCSVRQESASDNSSSQGETESTNEGSDASNSKFQTLEICVNGVKQILLIPMAMSRNIKSSLDQKANTAEPDRTESQKNDASNLNTELENISSPAIVSNTNVDSIDLDAEALIPSIDLVDDAAVTTGTNIVEANSEVNKLAVDESPGILLINSNDTSSGPVNDPLEVNSEGSSADNKNMNCQANKDDQSTTTDENNSNHSASNQESNQTDTSDQDITINQSESSDKTDEIDRVVTCLTESTDKVDTSVEGLTTDQVESIDKADTIDQSMTIDQVTESIDKTDTSDQGLTDQTESTNTTDLAQQLDSQVFINDNDRINDPASSSNQCTNEQLCTHDQADSREPVISTSCVTISDKETTEDIDQVATKDVTTNCRSLSSNIVEDLEQIAENSNLEASHADCLLEAAAMNLTESQDAPDESNLIITNIRTELCSQSDLLSNDLNIANADYANSISTAHSSNDPSSNIAEETVNAIQSVINETDINNHNIDSNADSIEDRINISSSLSQELEEEHCSDSPINLESQASANNSEQERNLVSNISEQASNSSVDNNNTDAAADFNISDLNTSNISTLDIVNRQLNNNNNEITSSIAIESDVDTTLVNKNEEMDSIRNIVNDEINAVFAGTNECSQDMPLIEIYPLYDPGVPEVVNNEAKVADNEPEVADHEREVADNISEVVDSEPEVANNETEVGDKEPDAADNESDVADNESEVLDSAHEVASNESKVANNEPEVADNEPEVVDNEPEISDNEIEIANSEHQVDKNEHDIANNEPEVADNEQNEADSADMNIASSEKKAADTENISSSAVHDVIDNSNLESSDALNSNFHKSLDSTIRRMLSDVDTNLSEDNNANMTILNATSDKNESDINLNLNSVNNDASKTSPDELETDDINSTEENANNETTSSTASSSLTVLRSSSSSSAAATDSYNSLASADKNTSRSDEGLAGSIDSNSCVSGEELLDDTHQTIIRTIPSEIVVINEVVDKSGSEKTTSDSASTETVDSSEGNKSISTVSCESSTITASPSTESASPSTESITPSPSMDTCSESVRASTSNAGKSSTETSTVVTPATANKTVSDEDYIVEINSSDDSDIEEITPELSIVSVRSMAGVTKSPDPAIIDLIDNSSKSSVEAEEDLVASIAAVPCSEAPRAENDSSKSDVVFIPTTFGVNMYMPVSQSSSLAACGVFPLKPLVIAPTDDVEDSPVTTTSASRSDVIGRIRLSNVSANVNAFNLQNLYNMTNFSMANLCNNSASILNGMQFPVLNSSNRPVANNLITSWSSFFASQPSMTPASVPLLPSSVFSNFISSASSMPYRASVTVNPSQTKSLGATFGGSIGSFSLKPVDSCTLPTINTSSSISTNVPPASVLKSTSSIITGPKSHTKKNINILNVSGNVTQDSKPCISGGIEISKPVIDSTVNLRQAVKDCLQSLEGDEKFSEQRLSLLDKLRDIMIRSRNLVDTPQPTTSSTTNTVTLSSNISSSAMQVNSIYSGGIMNNFGTVAQVPDNSCIYVIQPPESQTKNVIPTPVQSINHGIGSTFSEITTNAVIQNGTVQISWDDFMRLSGMQNDVNAASKPQIEVGSKSTLDVPQANMIVVLSNNTSICGGSSTGTCVNLNVAEDVTPSGSETNNAAEGSVFGHFKYGQKPGRKRKSDLRLLSLSKLLKRATVKPAEPVPKTDSKKLDTNTSSACQKVTDTIKYPAYRSIRPMIDSSEKSKPVIKTVSLIHDYDTSKDKSNGGGDKDGNESTTEKTSFRSQCQELFSKILQHKLDESRGKSTFDAVPSHYTNKLQSSSYSFHNSTNDQIISKEAKKAAKSRGRPRGQSPKNSPALIRALQGTQNTENLVDNKSVKTETEVASSNSRWDNDTASISSQDTINLDDQNAGKLRKRRYTSTSDVNFSEEEDNYSTSSTDSFESNWSSDDFSKINKKRRTHNVAGGKRRQSLKFLLKRRPPGEFQHTLRQRSNHLTTSVNPDWSSCFVSLEVLELDGCRTVCVDNVGDLTCCSVMRLYGLKGIQWVWNNNDWCKDPGVWKRNGGNGAVGNHDYESGGVDNSESVTIKAEPDSDCESIDDLYCEHASQGDDTRTRTSNMGHRKTSSVNSENVESSSNMGLKNLEISNTGLDKFCDTGLNAKATNIGLEDPRICKTVLGNTKLNDSGLVNAECSSTDIDKAEIDEDDIDDDLRNIVRERMRTAESTESCDTEQTENCDDELDEEHDVAARRDAAKCTTTGSRIETRTEFEEDTESEEERNEISRGEMSPSLQLVCEGDDS